jgi:hypothetical protein
MSARRFESVTEPTATKDVTVKMQKGLFCSSNIATEKKTLASQEIIMVTENCTPETNHFVFLTQQWVTQAF